ncbi:putative Cyanoglobin, partial [Rozella allomycis CSF55]
MTNLYDEIGGEKAIDAVVELFYTKLLKVDTMIPIFANTDMNKQRRMQKSFLNHVLGGKPYNGKSMKAAHARLKLTDAHFDTVIRTLGEAMKELKRPHVMMFWGA